MPGVDPEIVDELESDPTLCITGTDHAYELVYEDEEVEQHWCRVCGAETYTDKETGEQS